VTAAGPVPYRDPLALVHHRGFGEYADRCAPGILEHLEPLRTRPGAVLELGCGSGHLTRHLAAAGHPVIATDASPAMLALARAALPSGVELRRLALPDQPLPAAKAVVSVGHVLGYLADEAAIRRGLRAIALALAPGGRLVVDLCDLAWAAARGTQPSVASVAADWAVIVRGRSPSPERYVRAITAFVRDEDGSWRRDDEEHTTVLLETARVPALLAEHGVSAAVHTAIGDYELPEGLVAVIGERKA
jgi:SAM-dependent methyltransferase